MTQLIRTEPRVGVVIPAYNEQALIGGALESLYCQQGIDRFELVVVDNGSTDGTREVVDRFARAHDDFKLTVVEESRKGTGYAVSTGFEYLLSGGFNTIARTDADCIVGRKWLSSGVNSFERRGDLQTVTGPIMPREDDEYFRSTDKFVWPVAQAFGRIAFALLHKEPGAIRHAPGGNIMIRSSAYERVEGYVLGSIDEVDEDVDLTVKLRKEFGARSLGWNRGMEVYTSMRRLRQMGLLGMFDAYIVHPHDENTRAKASGGTMDIR